MQARRQSCFRFKTTPNTLLNIVYIHHSCCDTCCYVTWIWLIIYTSQAGDVELIVFNIFNILRGKTGGNNPHHDILGVNNSLKHCIFRAEADSDCN